MSVDICAVARVDSSAISARLAVLTFIHSPTRCHLRNTGIDYGRAPHSHSAFLNPVPGSDQGSFERDVELEERDAAAQADLLDLVGDYRRDPGAGDDDSLGAVLLDEVVELLEAADDRNAVQGEACLLRVVVDEADRRAEARRRQAESSRTAIEPRRPAP